MKKLIAVFMAAAMLFALSVPASAATAATAKNDLNWKEYEADVKAMGIDADFVPIADLNLMMWLPSVFSEEELTEKDIEDGYIAYYSRPDSSAVIAVTKIDIGESLEEWEKELPDYGVTDAEMGTVNGFQALMYSMPEDDSMCLDFETESGKLLEFTFYPMSDEGYQTVAAIIMASIQPVGEVLNWSDIEADVEAAGIDAKFVQIGDMNLKMWLPSVFTEQELTEEDVKNGYLSYLTTADGSAVIAIMKLDIGESLEEWEKDLPNYGVTDAEMGIVNGYRALVYSVPKDDTMCIDFEAESGEILEFTFYPMSDEGYQATSAIIMTSLQPVE